MYKKIIIKIFNFLKKVISDNKLLSLILLLAAILRFMGIYPGYHPYHSDEGMSYSSAIEMIKNLNLDPTRYDYPALIPIIHAIIYSFVFIPIFIPLSFIFFPDHVPSFKNIINLWQQFVFLNQQTIVLFWGRFVTAFFGVGVVLMVYLVAKNLFKSKNIALIASFLTAVNYRQVLNAHIALPDIYNGFFLLTSIFFISKLLDNPNRNNYLFSAISVALSFSTKFQILAFVPFLLTHFYLSIKDFKGLFIFLKILFSKRFLFSIVIIPLIIIALNFYHLLNWQEFVSVNAYTKLKYLFGIQQLNTYSIAYLYRIGIGELISIAILIGILISLWKYLKPSFILLSVVIPFFYIFSYYSGGGYYTRNFVTITPLLLIFSAVFIDQLFVFLKSLNFTRSTSFVVIVFLLIFISKDQIINSLISSYNYTREWSFESARKWAKTNIPDNSVVASHPWDKYPRDKNFTIIPFEASFVFSVAEMQEENAQFAFINMDWITLRTSWWINRNGLEGLGFLDKRIDILSNTYAGVAAKELSSWATAAFIKPWQSPEMNILISKIPEKINIGKKKELVQFTFDNPNDLNDWTIIDDPKFTKKKIYLQEQALKIEGGSRRIPITRAISPIISINTNTSKSKVYIVEANMKSATLLDKKNRDGIIRVDFYQDKPSLNLTTKNLYSTVFARHFGSTSWVQKQVTVIPPKEAKFMTVSFQIEGNSDFLFDDLKIYESEAEFENPRKILPYIDYKVADEILFPYSQGGL